jgi:uncharacterized membrane protein
MPRGSPMNYFPVSWPFLLGIGLLLAIMLVLIELRILRYAYEKVGLTRRSAMMVVLLSLFGSYINIPIAELSPEPVVSNEVVEFAGVRYIIPEVEQWPRTILAVNVGGAIVPTFVSIYLLVRNRLFFRGLIATALVTAVVHQLAQPVHGVGIAVPVFIPPIAAVAAALIIGREQAPALAYIAGSLGALIGADLLNLGRIQGLGAPVASIGGAGTFDGIFVTGVLAALLTPFTGRTTPQESPVEMERPAPRAWA